MKGRNILSLLLSVILLTGVLASPAGVSAAHSDSAAVASSGTTGDCTWKLENGTLTISGEGRMADTERKDYGSDFTEVVIEPGVTYIGREAFYCCKKLKTVTIAETVTGIGTWAFAYCEKLPSIVVPDSVTDLGYAIFDHCKALTLARLPEQVDSMSTSLFSNCENLTKVNIPRNATAVQEYMFQNCKSLTDIRIPDSVTKIGQYAFQNCETFLDMELPAHLTEIGQFAFDGCCNLRYINIPDGVKRFEGYVFRGCSQLKNIHIPDGTTLIGGRAFMDCASLQSVTLPDSVTAVNFGAFCGCSSLTRIDIPSGIAAVSASAFKDCTALTEATFHTGLKRIRENAFENCTSLCAAAIPAGTELIGDSAFYRCTSLTDVSIPDSVQTIGDLAFSETPWRESFPDGLVIVCNGVLNYCGDCPAEVTIPDGTAHIWGGAFQNKTTLQKINIPASVQYIGGYSFDGCAALTDITLPEGVNAVKRCTFQNCTSLREIVIPESITPNPSDYEGNETKELQYKCFAGCTALEYVYLPDCLPYLGWHQEFDGCTALKNLTLPKNTRLQHSRFYKNMNLKLSRVLFVDPTHDPSAYTSSDSTEGVTFYRIDTSGDCALSYDDFTLTVSGEGAMANYTTSKPAPWGYFPDFRTRVTSIVVEEGVTAIGDYAFRDFPHLTSVTLPDSLTSIGKYAFENCPSLRSVHLPEGLVTIGDSAFENCTALAEVNAAPQLTYLGKNALDNTAWLQSKPDGMVCLGDVFYTCQGACPAFLSLGNGIRVIAAGALSGCATLEQVEIRENIAFINNDAFKGCTELIAAGFFTDSCAINSGAFKSCSKLVFYCNQDSTAHTYAKNNSITYRLLNGTLGDCRWTLEGTRLIIYGSGSLPDQNSFFSSPTLPWGTDITEIILGKGVTSVGRNVFVKLNSLKKIVVQSRTTSFAQTCISDSAKPDLYCFEGSTADSDFSGWLLSRTVNRKHLGAKGDANLDGEINIEDATFLMRLLAEFDDLLLSLDDEDVAALGDAYADGVINIRDVTEIQRYLAEIISEFAAAA